MSKTTNRPPTREEIKALLADVKRADEDHEVAILCGDGTTPVETPVMAVPVEVFGVDELPIEDLREALKVWEKEPPPIPPRFVGLAPRERRRR